MATPTAPPPRYDDDAPPHRFLQLARAFGPSRAFQIACRAGVFGALDRAGGGGAAGVGGTGGLTAGELAAAVGFSADPDFRGPRDLFDLLVAEGVLEREGDGPCARYRNTPEAARYLVPGRPDYIGGLVVVNAERTYPQFVYLEHALRAGGAMPPEVNALVPDILATFGGAADPDATARFALGMTGANLATFRALAAKFDWSTRRFVRDIGGSLGTLACTLAAAHPHLRAATADLPALAPAARARVAELGLAGRVAVEAVDFFADAPFEGGADVVTMSMILHDWGEEKKRLLIKKAYDALPPGGAFIAVETLIDDARRANRWGLYMSLGMLAEFGAERAFDYSAADFAAWARAAGFERTEALHLCGAASAVVAHKAAAAAAAPPGPVR